jgi:4-amino-4-deoxy-L-arabinose transferase-like glycosyltransferase
MKNNSARKDKPGLKVAVLLIVLILCGSFLRLWNLGKTSFWVDEINTVYAAESFIETGEYLLPSGMPYERATLHLFLTSVAFRFSDINEASTRFPAAVFGILSLLLVYLVAKHVFNWKVGLFSVFLMAFSFFEIGWSRTARMYTLLQFLALLFLYLFLLGFESRKLNMGGVQSNSRKGNAFFSSQSFLNRWGISPYWLGLAALVIIVTYFYVHQLGVFLILGMIGYTLFLSLVIYKPMAGRKRFLNKYALTSLLVLLGGIFLYAALPGVRASLSYFLKYTPPWARSEVTAQNRFFLFEFLISPYRFPIGAMFVIGSVQSFFRFQRKGILLFMLFVCPLLLLSFVFAYRTPTYLFFVYPLFLILAAYGGINLIKLESIVSIKYLDNLKLKKDRFLQSFKKALPYLVAAAFLSVFVLAPWIRIGLHIPFNPDGITNGAVTPFEWREGTRLVDERRQDGDIIFSSLPATSLYYGVKADFTLNWSLLNQAKEENAKNAQGNWMDLYGGSECIETLEGLKAIVDSHLRGWLIIEKFHLENSDYISNSIKIYIDEQFPDPLSTQQGTVLVYHWNHSET